METTIQTSAKTNKNSEDSLSETLKTVFVASICIGIPSLAVILVIVLVVVMIVDHESLIPGNASQIGQRVFDNSEMVSIPNQWYNSKKIPYML